MRSPQENSNAVKVYYDGLCRVCSREIEHYRPLPKAVPMEFVDITAADFKAAEEGLDPVAVHKYMHVRRADGSLALGVDAFVEIWTAIPRYAWAARLAKRSLVRMGLEGFYQVFVHVRPYLPRKKADCAASPYCEVKS